MGGDNTSGLRRGGPGRKPGSKNKATLEARKLAQNLVNDKAYRENLLTRLREGKAGKIEVEIWRYAYGKPPDKVELGSDGTLQVQIINKILPKEE